MTTFSFIDRGEFGEVFQGTATDILGPATGPTPVAIKVSVLGYCVSGLKQRFMLRSSLLVCQTLRKGSMVEEQKKFLSEAALMA